MERTVQDKFELTAAEIDRSVAETADFLANEKIDPKDALQLRFLLEETILKYRDALSESAVASLRFSRFFGTVRVSLRIEGERFDPFTGEDPSETSVMRSLLARSDALSRAWLYRGGAAFTTTVDTLIGPLGVDADFAPLAYNLGGILFRPGYCIVFTACSLFTADLYGIEVTWAWLLAAFLLSFILSVATPPVIGGTAVCFSILFSQLGINAEALAMIISVNAIFEFLTVAVNNYCLQSQIVLLGNNFGKLDRDRLRA